MNRRQLLKLAAAMPWVPGLCTQAFGVALAASGSASRVRPGDAGWPSAARWDRLGQQVGGRLLRGESPLGACKTTPDSTGCTDFLKAVKNPYFISDTPGLTQTLCWPGAWTSRPSAYVVAAEKTEDVAAAVSFARDNNLRLVVKGGGHSYQGTSNSADSLLIWTHRMNAITLHDAFIPKGCEGTQAPQPAVSIGAGA